MHLSGNFSHDTTRPTALKTDKEEIEEQQEREEGEEEENIRGGKRRKVGGGAGDEERTKRTRKRGRRQCLSEVMSRNPSVPNMLQIEPDLYFHTDSGYPSHNGAYRMWNELF